MRKRISPLYLKPMRDALLNIQLQSVVCRVSDRLVQPRTRRREGVFECVVVHRIERQRAKFRAQPQVSELQCAISAAERIAWIAAEGDQLRDQRWLRRIRVYHPKNS